MLWKRKVKICFGDGCGKLSEIYFVKGQLCFFCNRKRLQRASAISLQQNRPKAKNKSITPQLQAKRKKDKDIYERVCGEISFIENGEIVLNERPGLFCEGTGVYLGESYADIVRRYGYKCFSHILSKGAHPSIRHDVRNFNLLTPFAHNVWEYGVEEKKMELDCYRDNILIIQKLKSEYYGTNKEIF